MAENYYKTSTVLKYDNKLPLCTISNQSAPVFVSDLLLERGFKVEIWTMENKQWTITKTASPGNLSSVQDFLFTANLSSSSMIAAVNIAGMTVGVAFIDLSTDKLFQISEFIDNDQFTNLEVFGY